MGQKVNPHGARVGVIKDWNTRWYADKKNFADNLVSDAKLRKMIKELEFVDDKSKKSVKLYDAGISSIDIERRFDNDKVRVTVNQIDDLIGEIDKRVKNDDKVLVTTITKRMAEELSKYFDRVGVRNRYIHSDVDTLERIQILEDLRAGMFDVLVGVNLLREGLDLPEVALVAILDADKEGFLRNVRSLTQIAGRAARHSQGNVILYADTCTDSMRYAIEQSNRRREKQVRYNMEHEMLPRRAQRSGTGQSALLTGRDTPDVNLTAYPIAEDHYAAVADVQKNYVASENIDALIDKAREEMERAAKSLDFLAAAKFRDRMYELQKLREENRNKRN